MTGPRKAKPPAAWERALDTGHRYVGLALGLRKKLRSVDSTAEQKEEARQKMRTVAREVCAHLLRSGARLPAHTSGAEAAGAEEQEKLPMCRFGARDVARFLNTYAGARVVDRELFKLAARRATVLGPRSVGPHDLCLIFCAYSACAVRGPDALDLAALCEVAIAHPLVMRLSGEDVAAIVSCAAVCLGRHDALLAGLAHRVVEDSLAATMTSPQLMELLWGFASVRGAAPQRLCVGCGRRAAVLAAARRLGNIEAAMIAWALAVLPHGHSAAVTALPRMAEWAVATKLNPDQARLLAYAWARAGLAQSAGRELFDYFAEGAMLRVQHWGPIDLSTAAWALAAAHDADVVLSGKPQSETEFFYTDLMGAIAERIASLELSEEVAIRQVCSVLWALAKVQYQDQRVLAELPMLLRERGQQLADTAQPGQVAQLLLSFSKLRLVGDGDVVELYCRRAADTAKNFRARHAANVLQAAGVMLSSLPHGLRLSLARSLMAQLKNAAFRKELIPCNVANLAWGCRRLGYRLPTAMCQQLEDMIMLHAPGMTAYDVNQVNEWREWMRDGAGSADEHGGSAAALAAFHAEHSSAQTEAERAEETAMHKRSRQDRGEVAVWRQRGRLRVVLENFGNPRFMHLADNQS